MSGRGRGQAFLIAAAALPLLVVAFFLVATAIPRWTVPPPAHDFVFSVDEPGDSRTPAETYTFAVRGEQVVASVTRLAPNTYAPRTRLMLFDHESGAVREVGVVAPAGVVPEPSPGGGTITGTFVVEELSGRRAIAAPVSPDGYRFETGQRGGGGIIGELFGMRSGSRRLSLVRDGRVVALDAPSPVYAGSARAVAWLTGEGGRP